MRSYKLMSLLMIFGSVLSFVETGNVRVLITGIGVGLLIYFGTKLIIEKFGDIPQ